ncbi:MAG: ATPase, T2SS/T4P/T4SS family [Chloroflexota bacterium]|nr:ATPase, T2SS/T4P/T4SS family [Chloroflexota bacterium]
MPTFGLSSQATEQKVPPALLAEVAPQVAQQLATEFGGALLAPTDAERAAIRAQILQLVRRAGHQHGLQSGQLSALEEQVLALTLGYGFLEPFLNAAAAEEISEVVLNPAGALFVQPTESTEFWPVVSDPAGRLTWLAPRSSRSGNLAGYCPSPLDVEVTLAKLLASVGAQANQTNPIVSVKLPPSPRLGAGARVHVVLPPVAVGAYPALNIRFYVAHPVDTELLVEKWRMLSPRIAAELRTIIQTAGTDIDTQGRLVVAGATGSGKTTFLSWLISLIPPANRLLTAEDPAELYFDHPNRVTLEVQHADGREDSHQGVQMLELVTSAMRMTPAWLIVGEVRGAEALPLLRAQMSGHNGLSTIHANSAENAAETFTLLVNLFGGSRYSRRALKELFIRSVDYIVQLGLDPYGKRRLLSLHRVAPQLHGGDIKLLPRFRYDRARSTAAQPVWQEVAYADDDL